MDGYLSGEQSGLNKKIGAVTLLVLMSLAVALTPIAIVFGQSESSVANYRLIRQANYYNGYKPHKLELSVKLLIFKELFTIVTVPTN